MASLNELVVDEQEINEELLTETLKPFVRIGNDSGNLIFKPGFNDLDGRKKVLVALTGIRAAKELGYREEEKIGPTQLSELTGIPDGTLKVYMSEFEEDNILDKENGKYWIHPAKVRKVQEEVSQDE